MDRVAFRSLSLALNEFSVDLPKEQRSSGAEYGSSVAEGYACLLRSDKIYYVNSHL